MVGTTARTLLLVRLLSLELYYRMVEGLVRYGLTPTQYMVLSLASDHPSLSTADMARRFQITPQSMNQTVATLLAKRLISRRVSPSHGRILHIGLTPSGSKVLARCDTAIDRLEKSAFGHFVPREMADLRKLLTKALSHTRRKP
jgi:DNA-binding MarR family transcriptional regulator